LKQLFASDKDREIVDAIRSVSDHDREIA
jgi:hypothetical protein